MSPFFSRLAGLNLTKDTLQKLLGPMDSTYVGYCLIYVLMKLWFEKKEKEAFYAAVLTLMRSAHTLSVFPGKFQQV